MTALSRFNSCGFCSYRSVSCDFKDNFIVLLVLFHLPPWKWWGVILIFHEPLRYHGNENFHFKSEYSILWHIFFFFEVFSEEAIVNIYIIILTLEILQILKILEIIRFQKNLFSKNCYIFLILIFLSEECSITIIAFSGKSESNMK